MPPRSVKMKRRIFGFQRRVWWPKWTPASRSSRIETTDIGLKSPFWLLTLLPPGLAGTGLRPEPAPPPRLIRRVGLRSGGHSSGRLQILRQRGLDLDPLAREGGVEGKARRVEELALEAELMGPAVERVAGD